MKHLTLLTWPDYVNPLTLAGFEREFGVMVDLDIVPSAVELIERIYPFGYKQAGGRKGASQGSGSQIDLLVPPDYAVRALSAQGRLLELDHAQLSNLHHLALRFSKGRVHDPESRFSIIKDWGTTGFMYRSDLIDERPVSWTDFWSLAEKCSGRVTVLDSPGEVIGAALKMRGYSYNASSAEALSAVREALFMLKPHLLAFESNYKPLLASGEAVLALGWNGDAAALMAQGVPLKYAIPSEGSQIWEDDWAISAGTHNSELAHTFLNYFMRPEVAVQEARYTRYATGNRSALAMLEDELRNDPATYPGEELLRKLEAGMPLDAEGQERREELWKEVRGN